jgi:glycine betaine/choline ABC-type transport system substrate-binding protein
LKRAKSRNQLRRQKAKLKKATTEVCTSLLHPGSALTPYNDTKAVISDTSAKKEDDIQQIEDVQYVSEQLDLNGAATTPFLSPSDSHQDARAYRLILCPSFRKHG